MNFKTQNHDKGKIRYRQYLKCCNVQNQYVDVLYTLKYSEFRSINLFLLKAKAMFLSNC